MKPVFFLALILSSHSLFGQSEGQDKPMDAITLKIIQASAAGIVKLEVRNSSEKPVKLFKESNSWGAGRWRLLLIRNGKLELFSETLKKREFTRNFPAFDEFAKGAHFEQKLDLNGEEWCDVVCGKKVSFKSADTIIVIYDVPVSTEGFKLGVWWGVVATLTTVP